MRPERLRQLLLSAQSALMNVEIRTAAPNVVDLTLHIPKPYRDITSELLIAHRTEVRDRVRRVLQDEAPIGIVFNLHVHYDPGEDA